jgi:hypothetical protein
MKKLRIALLFALAVFLGSCEDEETTPDYLAESIGEYSYSARIFDSNNTVVDNVSGELTLSRNGNDLTLVIDGDETIKSSRVELATNGFGFDIESVTLPDSDGDLVVRSGQTAASVEGREYHGRYDSGSNQLYLNLNYIYQDSQFSDFNLYLEVIASKK